MAHWAATSADEVNNSTTTAAAINKEVLFMAFTFIVNKYSKD
jgi:hypothetical protein